MEECRVEGCPRPVVAKGFCRGHYNALYRRGEVGSARITPRPACSVDGCERHVVGHGYCMTHWRRWKRHQDPRADVPVRRYVQKLHAPNCTPDNCN